MSIDSSVIPNLPEKAEMPRYTRETALAKGEVQQRIPSVITTTRQATSKRTAGPKEAEKKGKDRQVKDEKWWQNCCQYCHHCPCSVPQ
jgi:hypothetical protein